MRNAEELSITTAPAATAAGASARAASAPAENSTSSRPAKPSMVASSMRTGSPRNLTLRPAERPDANSLSEETGKPRFSRQASISVPTAPVAPTMPVRTGALRRAPRGSAGRAARLAVIVVSSKPGDGA